MNRNVFANETNGNNVRRRSTDGAALLGWITLSIKTVAKLEKKGNGFSFLGGWFKASFDWL